VRENRPLGLTWRGRQSQRVERTVIGRICRQRAARIRQTRIARIIAAEAKLITVGMHMPDFSVFPSISARNPHSHRVGIRIHITPERLLTHAGIRRG
jgi:hypothetical protein